MSSTSPSVSASNNAERPSRLNLTASEPPRCKPSPPSSPLESYWQSFLAPKTPQATPTSPAREPECSRSTPPRLTIDTRPAVPSPLSRCISNAEVITPLPPVHIQQPSPPPSPPPSPTIFISGDYGGTERALSFFESHRSPPPAPTRQYVEYVIGATWVDLPPKEKGTPPSKYIRSKDPERSRVEYSINRSRNGGDRAQRGGRTSGEI